ncbi:MAG: IS1380 family transposase [Thermoleophilia bacterium]|nr:IS1380 family transposase [Thermoleophilia bacterium]
MVKHSSPVRIEKIKPCFDDARLVSDAGLIIPATLAERLGLAKLINEKLDLGSRPGAVRPERKAMTLIYAMLAGADSIDDCDLLRSGATEAVLAHKALAPSTLGTFLRSMSFGHVRQLESISGELLRRAWSAGAGPVEGERLTIDLDSFVGQVHGYQKQGAGFGYTGERGLHPLLATRAGTGEILGIRLREGSANTQRGIQRFLEELIPRVRRAGATGEILIRADSGFWRAKTFELLEEKGISYSIGVRQQGKVPEAIAEIPESAWQRLEDYPEPGLAEIAETICSGRRLIVRRVRELSDQQELLPGWRHHAFMTNRTEEIGVVEAEHRKHAVIELAIRDLKAGALAHFPSGHFSANSAWTQFAAVAHNLARFSQVIGSPGRTLATLPTFQRKLLQVPGRITRSARQTVLHLPARWPWRIAFMEALSRIRALPTLA